MPHRHWTLFARALLLVGLAVSLGGGALWRTSVRSHERQSFEVGATDVSETLETLIARDSDFVGTVRAAIALEPNMSATRFDQWFAQLQGKQRELGGLGTTVVEAVPPANSPPSRRGAVPIPRSARSSPARSSRCHAAAGRATACCQPAAP